jgi:Tfp pilus assembly protein PilF
MKTLASVLILTVPVLLTACVTPSLPLPANAGANAVAGQQNAEGIKSYDMGHWETAKGHFEAAIKAEPMLAEAHYNLALTLDKLDNHELARNHFRIAAELAPHNTAITESSAYRHHMDVRRGSRSGFDGGSGYGGMLGY